MPDRGVVECPKCKGAMHEFVSFEGQVVDVDCALCGGIGKVAACGRCGGPLSQTWDPDEGGLVWTCENPAPVTPAPRALVAISEDRQWLVVLEPELEGHPEAASVFSVWQWDMRAGHVMKAVIPDTGQDAHAVLAAFLEGRKG